MIFAQLEIPTNIDNALLSNGVPANFSGTTQIYASCFSGLRFGLVLAIIGNTNEVIEADLTVNNIELNIVDVKSTVGQLTQWYNLHDALNKNLNFLTGKFDYLYSELLGHKKHGYASNGCYAETLITNGFRIRGLNDDKKHLHLVLMNL